MEEIYMEQFEGFKIKEQEHNVTNCLFGARDSSEGTDQD